MTQATRSDLGGVGCAERRGREEQVEMRTGDPGMQGR